MSDDRKMPDARDMPLEEELTPDVEPTEGELAEEQLPSPGRTDQDPIDKGISDRAETEEVPAGREGADSGAADAVRVDSEGTAEMPDESGSNDIPGVGPRKPEDEDDAEEEMDAYRASRSTSLDDETGGAPHLNQREAPAPND